MTTLIQIRERPGPAPDGGAVAAEITIGHDGPYAVTIPPLATAADESLLEWYFEQHLRFPFTDFDRVRAAEAVIQAYGETLFRALFEDRDLYARYCEAVRPGVDTLSIEVMGRPTFHALHWEALKNPADPHALALHVPMVRRRLEAPSIRCAPMRESPTVNILVLTARPGGRNDVGYRTISRPLVEALRKADLPARIDIVRPGTFRALSHHLAQMRDARGAGYYHVLHLDVHGAVLTHEDLQRAEASDRVTFRYGRGALDAYEGRKAFLFLEGDGTGKADPVEAGELAALLTHHGIPIAILNACQSGKQVGAEETSLASRLMDAGAQMVLGMSYSVTVSAARLLMPFLYQRLLAGDGVTAAIRRGRAELANDRNRQAYYNQTIELADWLLPVVYQNQPVVLNRRDFTPAERAEHYTRLADHHPEPRTAYGFVGRDLDILEIERRLLTPAGDTGHALLLVRGMGGAGKTTLLNHLGYWWQTTGLVDRVFVFAYDQRAWTAAQIRDSIARSLLGDARYHAEFLILPAPAQGVRLAELLRAERHLLILDNLESVTGAELAIQNTLPAQEREALRRFLASLTGGRTLVLLGSRGDEDWLATDTFADNRYEVSGLDEEAASNLAERILERHLGQDGATKRRNEPAFADLMRLLAGYPLALEIVLPNLTRQTAAAVVAALRAGDAGLDHDGGGDKTRSLMRCIDYSHGNLSPDAQDLLTCLAPFTGVVFAPLLEEYSEHLRTQPALPFDQWPAVLAEAHNWGLLTPHGTLNGFLALQPVLPYFLRNRWSQPDKAPLRAAIETAFCDLYDGAARQIAHLQLSKTPNERRLGQALAEAEYENLHTALFLAIAGERSILGPYTALSRHLDARHDEARGLALGTAVLDAIGLSDPAHRRSVPIEDIIGVIHDVANRLLGLKDYPKAQEKYDQALEWWTTDESVPPDLRRQRSASIYHQLGSVAEEQRRWGEAEKHYKNALDIKIEFNDRYEQAGTLHQLGRVAEEQRRWDEAENHYKNALDIFIEFNDRYEQARTLHQLGSVAQEQRRWGEAENHYKNALDIFIEFNDRYEQARTLHQLGIVAQQQRRWDEAENHYKNALEIYREFNDRYEQASTLHQLGIVAQQQRRWDEAENHYKNALDIKIEFNDRYGQAGTLHQLGRVAQEQRRWDEAENHYKNALDIKIEFNDRYGQAGTLHQLGIVAQQQRRWDEAENHYKNALDIKIEFNDRYEQASTLHQLGSVAQQQRRWDEAEKHYKNALDIKIEFNDRYGQAGTLHQLGSVAQEQRRWDEAEKHYKSALDIYRKFKDRYGQAGTLHQLGRIAEEQRRWDAAKGVFVQALEIFREYEDQHNATIVLRSLARLWRASGDAGILAAVAALFQASDEEVRNLFQHLTDGGAS